MADKTFRVRAIDNYYDLFTPLDPSRKEIRLAVLYPTDEWPEITLGLLTVSMMEEPIAPYEALSYSWGDIDDVRTVAIRHRVEGDTSYVNEQRFRITANLEAALTHLRYEDRFRLMWIDAISIDQSDRDERTQQVSSMQEIYANAARVLIWPADVKHEMVPVVTYYIGTLAQESGMEQHELLGPDGLNFSPSQLIKTFPPPESLDERRRAHYQATYTAMAKFFSLPWFRRVWVLQEVVHSSSSTWVQYGKYRLHWGAVVLASYWHSEAVRYLSDVPNNVKLQSDLPELWQEVAWCGKHKRMKILDIIFLAHEFHASDPRDKIYALLSLAEDTYQIDKLPENMQPDYSKDGNEVYTEFTRGLIDQYGSLDILSLVDIYHDLSYRLRIRTVGFPTWVPNYDEGPYEYRILGRLKSFCASGQTQVVVHPPAMKGSLLVQGIRSDKVATVLPVRMGGDPDTWGEIALKTSLGPLHDAISVLWSFAVRYVPTPYPNGEDILEAYIQTLICDPQVFGEYENIEPAKHETVAPASQVTSDHIVPSSSSSNENLKAPTQNPNLTNPEDPPPSANPISTSKLPEALLADFAASWQTRDPTFSAMLSHQPRLQALAPLGDKTRFQNFLSRFLLGRMFFVTEAGYMGLCPNGTQIGDHVVLLAGGRVPFILRTGAEEEEEGGVKVEDGVGKKLVINFLDDMSMYQVLPDPFAKCETSDAAGDGPDGEGRQKKEPWFEFIGEAYVHGIMFGSAWEMAERRRDEFPLRVFDMR